MTENDKKALADIFANYSADTDGWTLESFRIVKYIRKPETDRTPEPDHGQRD